MNLLQLAARRMSNPRRPRRLPPSGGLMAAGCPPYLAMVLHLTRSWPAQVPFGVMRFDTWNADVRVSVMYPSSSSGIVAIPDFTKTLGTLLAGLRSKTSLD